MLTALPAFEDNYIWLYGTPGARIVVDPGDPDVVLDALAGETPAAVFITHHHADHIGGLRQLNTVWPDTPVYAPEDERIQGATRRVRDGDGVRVADMVFNVIEVPGHTLSHIAYFGEGHLFCGDTLFSLGCGRLFEGTPAMMLASLEKIAALPANTRVCCAHEYTEANARFALEVDPGNENLRAHVVQVHEMRVAGQPSLPSSIEIERNCNPFLRTDTAEVRRSVQAHAGQIAHTRDATFAALRAWKDVFR